MATSPVPSDASHESDDAQDNNTSKSQHAVKDKECQYCHQKFTSSSLGRHLDQFISKKKPDGIHDVEGIKKLRAGITRRTARGGKRNDSHDPSDSHLQSGQTSPHSSGNNVAPHAFQVLDDLHKSSTGSGDFRFNRVGWQATGVIPDSVPQAVTASTFPSPLNASGNGLNQAAGSKRTFSTYAADLPNASTSATANETARALELSLREVLDAVNSATKRIAPNPPPFPFDLTTQTFPALCLALLPTPATLFQSTPFSTSTTIPLKPPGPEQLHALRSKIRIALDDWKWGALAHFQRTAASQNISPNVGEEAERLSQTTQKQIDECLRHLDSAYQYFVSQNPEQQYSLWSIELLRSLKVEQDKVKEVNERMSRITQEASQLQQQIDYLSRCQWPREMALWPPERNSFSSEVQKELQKTDSSNGQNAGTGNNYGTSGSSNMLGGGGDDKWDFDKLVNKWKRHVREDRARRGGGAGSMLPPLTDNHGDSGGFSSSLRKANSDLSGLNNGHTHNSNSISDPSNVRNGVYNLGINDRVSTFANSSTQGNTSGGGNAQRQYAGIEVPRFSSPPTGTTAPFPQTSNILSSLDPQTALTSNNLERFGSEMNAENDLSMAGDSSSMIPEAMLSLHYTGGVHNDHMSSLGKGIVSGNGLYPTRNHHMRL